ncbi:lipoate--protein ligase family protein [Leptothoe sp. PORK10 BA2]|uniref:lipoate--protein ligase family protein n=1 Tax=Leptothoe sp. PORK10 BA2 TaxID=3110254 RepID=UPI002B1E9CB4|nr:biotin/lipoate A/B protein ligase family protein [Leptothoe sp. PORK10 BA2]MEA5462938.1 biotin/lipoate A/B protein ligase family protein [Leptothoe sp. PORK10 BA2]
MVTPWRLILPIEASGETQMAIDEWLLEQHRLGEGPACLRFYTWAPIAISLGYHQRHYPEHWHNLQWNNQTIELVRRPSGGRAVLHQGDLTYSLITSGHRGRRREVYADLCKFLIDGWLSLGITLHLGSEQHSYQRSANCFGTATAADLVMGNGYKVIGSAQLYRDRCILQHGSIRLMPDPVLVEQVFGQQIRPPRDLMAVQPNDVVEALITSAQRIFGIQFQMQPLSYQEEQQALAWVRAKATST